MTRWIGLDIAKDSIEVGQWPEQRSWQVDNTTEGIAALAEQVVELAPTCVVVEASGGYEHEAAATLSAAGLPVAVVNPRQVRDYAKSIGQLAKTDRLDALLLARFAEAVRPEPRPLSDEATRELHSLLLRRSQVIGMITAEKNRLKTANKAIRAPIQAHIAYLEGQRDDLDGELTRRLHESPIWREKEELLRSVKGIGPVASVTLLAALPELGTLSHKQIASLVGLAPFARDSGRMRGKRTIWGGRARVRQGLYMATLIAIRYNPSIQQFHDRLIARGKPKMVVVTACMHKLLLICNAILRSGVRWEPAHAA